MMWNIEENVPAPDGEVVITLTRNGLEQELIKDNGRWWFPDRSMYVYYTPLFWKRMGT